MSLILVTRDEHEALKHAGVKGMKWHSHRWWNEDKTLTEEGKKHYGIGQRIKDNAKYLTSKDSAGMARALAEKYEHKSEHARSQATKHIKDAKDEKASKQISKASQFDELAKKYREEEQYYTTRDENRNKSDKQIKKDVDDLVKRINDFAEKNRANGKEVTNVSSKLLDAAISEESRAKVLKEAVARLKEQEKAASDKQKAKEEKNAIAAEAAARLEKEDQEAEARKEAEKEERRAIAAEAIARMEEEDRKAEEAERLRKKTLNQLTNDELDERITRLQKEKLYSQLVSERAEQDKSTIRKTAEKLLKQAIDTLSSKAINKLGDELAKKIGKTLDNAQKSNADNDSSDANNKDSSSGDKKEQKFSKAEKSQIRSMAGSGKSVADIAKALGVPEEKVKNYMSAAGVTVS